MANLRIRLSVGVIFSRKKPFGITCIRPFHISPYNKSILRFFPQKLVELVKQELKIIAQSLISDDPMIHFPSNLDLNIAKSLSQSVDDYNRFLKLLTFHPADIPPELYLEFISKALPMDENARNLVVKRLTFHRLYDEIFTVFIDESSTIGDVEDLVQIMGQQSRNNGHYMGFVECVLAGLKVLPNQTLQGVFLDTVAHTFDINKLVLMEFVDTYTKLPVIVKPVHQMNVFELLIVARFQDQVDPQIIEVLQTKLEKHHTGWLSFINKPHLVSILPGDLNDYDMMVILDLTPSQVYDIFITRYSKLGSSWFLNKYLVGLNDASLISTVIKHNSHRLSNQAILLGLTKLCTNPQLLNTCLTVLTNESRDYNDVFDQLLPKLDTKHQWSYSIHKALLLTNNSPNFGRKLRLKLKFSHPEAQDIVNLYKNFISSEHRPRKVLLEITRSVLLRNQVIDEQLVFLVIQSLVEKYSQIENGKLIFDGKIKLNKSIRELSQIISLLNNQHIISILNQSISQLDQYDKSGRLSKSLITETLNFIYRKQIPGKVLKVIELVDIPKKEYWYIMYSIKMDPNKSLEYVEEYRDNKSWLTSKKISAIEMGILKSNINVSDRFDLFKSFRGLLKQYGFRSKIRSKTLISLLEIILNSPQVSSNVKQNVILYSIKHKLPQHLINRLVRNSKKC